MVDCRTPLSNRHAQTDVRIGAPQMAAPGPGPTRESPPAPTMAGATDGRAKMRPRRNFHPVWGVAAPSSDFVRPVFIAAGVGACAGAVAAFLVLGCDPNW
jgi:hypothetical protein